MRRLATLSGAGQLQLGMKLTSGLGAGANPDWAVEPASKTQKRSSKRLKCGHGLITTGLGGGTGTGAARSSLPCQRNGALTVAVITRPFGFEASAA